MSEDRLQVIFGHIKKTQPICNLTSAVGENRFLSGGFQYTLNNTKLNFEQRKFYEENGFVVIRNLVPHGLLDVFRGRFLDIVDGRVPKGRITMMKDISLLKEQRLVSERTVNKIQDFCWDDVLSQFITLPEILDFIECFTGPNIMAMHTMLINKPPDTGTRSSRHPMHQDLHYFPFRPSNSVVCAWTAMEKVNKENGCLFVVPGSHRGVLERHEYPDWEKGVNKMYHGVRGFDDAPKVLLPMEKGDTVFFHPILLHGSGDNTTTNFRKAISCHYASSDCHYIDVRGTSQESIAKEVEAIAKKRGIDGLEFKDVWKLRSRVVRGREGTLGSADF